MTPWALKFLDAANGESLLTADQPDSQFLFRLILTDRRLIVLSPLDIGSGNKPWELTVPDRYFMTWPLHNLVSIEAKPVEIQSSKMTIKTDTGESHTWQFSPPFDNFAAHVKNALPKASNPLVFPAGEELFFEGGSNLEILNLAGDSPFSETELLVRQFFNKFTRLLASDYQPAFTVLPDKSYPGNGLARQQHGGEVGSAKFAIHQPSLGSCAPF